MKKNRTNILLLLLLLPIFAWAQDNPQGVMRFSMEDAIKYALDNSYQTQRAMQDVYKSKKQIWEATAIGLPQINGGIDYAYNMKLVATPIPKQFVDPSAAEGETILASFGTKQTFGTSVSVSQIIFDGSYIVGLQSAKTVAAIAELAKEKTDILVKEAVSNAYTTVLINDETIVILKRNIESIESNIKDVSAMFENGFSEEQDVQQLELTLGSLKNALNQSIRMAEINREMLKFSMGMDLSQPLELTDDIDNLLLSSYEVTSLDEALNLENHIDFEISKNKLKTDELLLRYEKTKYMPNISAFLNAGYNSYSQVFDFFQFKSDQWAPMAMVGLKLNIPIFSSFQRKARVDMAKIDLQKSHVDQDQLAQSLFLQLHNAQSAYAYALDNYKTNKKNKELAESIERKENIKYQEGISTSLDLTNAQNQLYNSQQNYMIAISQVIQSKIALDKALNKL